jgi:regulator of protease activity HflC (stomatin/prohibitin superfamily)
MWLFNLFRGVRSPKLSMWQTFYIKPNEIGTLYHRSDFKKILPPGTYSYFGRYWQVITYDLNEPEAKIDNLELLLKSNAAELQQHLLVVRTAFNQAALVRCGQNWISVAPNQLRAFWRGLVDVEARIFNLEESLELPAQFVRQLRSLKIDGVKKLQILESEIGSLYVQNNFVRFLESGEYAFWTFDRDIVVVKTYKLNQSEAIIDNLELLLTTNAADLQQYLLVVKTEFNQAALVRCGQNWVSVAPNQLKAFWRGLVDVETHIFNLEESLELPAQFVQQLAALKLDGVKKLQILESEIGLLYIQNNFVQTLETREYAFWTFNRDVAVQTLSQITPNPDFPLENVLIEKHPDFVAAYCELVQLQNQQVAIVRHLGKVIALLPPTSRKLFWQGVEVEIIDITQDARLTPELIAEIVSGAKEVQSLTRNSLHICQVPPQHVGLLYVNQEFQSLLPSGTHAWWLFGRSFQTDVLDLRLQNIEVSGQDILSKDKVPLRLNLTAGFRIQDPLRAKSELVNVTEFLYKELQFALRAAVGEQTLDALLENKGAVDTSVSNYIRTKTAEYGIEVDSVGVKDIILPGEIKTILSKVVEAEKAAQANVVRRREETAATRSMLNTAKVMEDNPVALRLKELEVLERIAEKIDRIQVNGSLDSILTDLIQINRP